MEYYNYQPKRKGEDASIEKHVHALRKLRAMDVVKATGSIPHDPFHACLLQFGKGYGWTTASAQFLVPITVKEVDKLRELKKRGAFNGPSGILQHYMALLANIRLRMEYPLNACSYLEKIESGVLVAPKADMQMMFGNSTRWTLDMKLNLLSKHEFIRSKKVWVREDKEFPWIGILIIANETPAATQVVENAIDVLKNSFKYCVRQAPKEVINKAKGLSGRKAPGEGKQNVDLRVDPAITAEEEELLERLSEDKGDD